MSIIDPREVGMIPGLPKPIPALVVLNEEDKKQYIVQRVAVMLIADDLVARIAATVALATAKEVLGALEEAGVAPKGTLQKYTNDVESEGTSMPSEAPPPTSAPAEPANASGIPQEP